MNLKTIRTIAKKEFFSFLNTPLSFIIIVPFLFLSTFIYLRTTFVVGEASLRSYFELLPWFLVLLAPALSMKLLTDEKRAGTLDLLFAHPLSEPDIVLGKFFGSLLFYLVILATTLALPFSLLSYANPDPGIIIAQYIGAVFVGATFLSLGLLASAYVTNTIGSFLSAAAASFFLILIGLEFVTLMFPWPLNRVVEELAIMTHMSNIARGLLDIRDILYFVTFGAVAITATIFKLSERRVKEDAAQKRILTLALLLIIGIGIALNIFMSYYPVRIDLTQQKQFTLSAGTRQTVHDLPDVVTVTVYASRNLPGQMQLTFKEVEDLLKDYQRFGSKLSVKTVFPDADLEAEAQAKQAGIQEVTFNRIGSGRFEAQSGFLGLVIRYGDKSEAIPFIQDTGDLEYQITRRMRKLVQTKETKVGIYSPGLVRLNQLTELLSTQYKVEPTELSELKNPTQAVQNLAALLVIDDGTSTSTASGLLRDYVEAGGKVLMAVDGVSINEQSLTASKSQSSASAFLSDYGVSMTNELVYDLQLNETLTFGGGNVRYIAPYPFWLRAIPAQSNTPITSGLKSITLAWPSALTLLPKDTVTATTLLTTGQTAGKQKDTYTIAPQDSAKLTEITKETIPLAVSLEKKSGGGRVVVVGDSDFVTDQFIQNNAENAAFIVNAVDYLASDQGMASIPKKTSSRAVFLFKNPIEPVLFQYGNTIAPPLAVIVFAIWWMARRRKGTRRHYV